MARMLVVVVDGTVNMKPYWETIRTTILDCIIRKFCEGSSSASEDDPFGGRYALNLVVFATDDTSVARPPVQFGWSNSMDQFLYWLSRLTFTNSSLNRCALTGGLSTALSIFPSTRNRTKAQLSGKRHCILVTASHPSPWPRQVVLPQNHMLASGEISEIQINSIAADAEAVAGSFVQSFVSLSVICPNEMQALRTIYDAGNSFKRVPWFLSVEFKHPQLLILISEKFPEAREALRQLETVREQDSILSLAHYFLDDEIMKLWEGIPFPDGQVDFSVDKPSEYMEQMHIQLPAEDDEKDDLFTDMTFADLDFDKIMEDLPAVDLDYSVDKPSDSIGEEYTLLPGNDQVLQQKSSGGHTSNDLATHPRNPSGHTGNDQAMLQRSSRDDILGNPCVSAGAAPITAEQGEGFSTLISKNLWRFEVVSSNFEASSTNVTASEQTSMVKILHPQENGGFGKIKEKRSYRGTSSSQTTRSSHHPYQRKNYSKPTDAVPLVNSRSVQNNPMGTVMAPISNALGDLNISHHHTVETEIRPPINLGQRRVDYVPAMHNAVGSCNSANLRLPPSSRAPVARTNAGNMKSSLSTNGPMARTHSLVASVSSINERSSITITSSAKEVPESTVPMETHGAKEVSSTKGPMRKFSSAGSSSEGSNSRPMPQFFGAAQMASTVTGRAKSILSPATSLSDPNRMKGLPVEAEPKGHIKAWEGSITSRGEGIQLFVSKLVAYRKPNVPEKIFDNWPKMMQLTHFVPQIYLNNSPYQGDDLQYLVFKLLDSCPTWERMKALNLCAYVNLPGQTLMLTVSKDEYRLVGILYEQVLPLYDYQIFQPNW